MNDKYFMKGEKEKIIRDILDAAKKICYLGGGKIKFCVGINNAEVKK